MLHQICITSVTVFAAGNKIFIISNKTFSYIHNSFVNSKNAKEIKSQQDADKENQFIMFHVCN